jgi:hypothetical protein
LEISANLCKNSELVECKIKKHDANFKNVCKPMQETIWFRTKGSIKNPNKNTKLKPGPKAPFEIKELDDTGNYS